MLFALACGNQPPPPHLRRRSTINRPSFISGQAVADKPPDRPSNGQLPPTILQPTTTTVTSRHGDFPRRSLRRRERMEDHPRRFQGPRLEPPPHEGTEPRKVMEQKVRRELLAPGVRLVRGHIL